MSYFCRADRSMYHAVGYGTLMYLQATLTFEMVSISNKVFLVYGILPN